MENHHSLKNASLIGLVAALILTLLSILGLSVYIISPDGQLIVIAIAYALLTIALYQLGKIYHNKKMMIFAFVAVIVVAANLLITLINGFLSGSPIVRDFLYIMSINHLQIAQIIITQALVIGSYGIALYILGKLSKISLFRYSAFMLMIGLILNSLDTAVVLSGESTGVILDFLSFVISVSAWALCLFAFNKLRKG